jgi:MoxR-like ATPase
MTTPRRSTTDDRRHAALALQAECRSAFESGQEVKGWKDSRNRINKLADRMRQDFVDRDRAINGILAALISRAGCVLLGPPGTAKSLLVNRIAKECDLRIGTEDANYFEYLLTAHTMPEEIFGPTDIGQLLQDPPQVQRRTEARLPHAELAFLDEVFRGGSHILNTLLTILNERKFHNGRTIEEVPLVSFIGAANFPPQTDELKAFFDRFPVRIWVDSVLKVSGSKLVEHGSRLISADSKSVASNETATNRPSMGDFRRLWSILRLKMRVSDTDPTRGGGRLQEYTRNFKAFQEEGRLSDRSFVQLWYFAGALDMVDGRDPEKSFAQGGRGHFECFAYVAPSTESLGRIQHHRKSIEARQSASGA